MNVIDLQPRSIDREIERLLVQVRDFTARQPTARGEGTIPYLLATCRLAAAAIELGSWAATRKELAAAEPSASAPPVAAAEPAVSNITRGVDASGGDTDLPDQLVELVRATVSLRRRVLRLTGAREAARVPSPHSSRVASRPTGKSDK